MPKVKQIQQLKHPNSRKTKTLAKQIHKQKNRDKSKFSTNLKLNLQGEKCAWFRDNLDPDCVMCSANTLLSLILKYLARFDEELEQIRIKHSIGNRKNRQHANREDIIKMTIKREFEDFNTCGIELPNLLDPIQLENLKKWNGELRFLQNFKFKMFSKKSLEEEQKKMEKYNENAIKSGDSTNTMS
ncbi:translation machinery-associated protein 16 homolog [Diorhabda sublineata]|uniref:translation machinery-associated protein 16 homolog n=1 Tax=Diorhabda sublineata TaxID=1163346 RepID=UPI0024E1601F|nr:translation machinery-associated protein 16 homolog [Diorhabda sublineata]